MPAGRRCVCWLGVFFQAFCVLFFLERRVGRKVRRSRRAAARRPMVACLACAAQGEGEGEAREEDGGVRCQRGGGVAAPARPGGAGPAPLRSAVAEERGASARGAPTIETLAKKKLKGAVLSSPGRGRRPRHVDARANTRRSLRCAVPRGELRRAAGFGPASRPTSPPRLAQARVGSAGAQRGRNCSRSQLPHQLLVTIALAYDALVASRGPGQGVVRDPLRSTSLDYYQTACTSISL